MIIREAQYERCGECNGVKRQMIDRIHGCDSCGKQIGEESKISPLNITIFRKKDQKTIERHYCSWACVFQAASKIKTDHFFTLPYVSFDEKAPGMRPSDFTKALKDFGQAKEEIKE